jgi:hypothetical protein
MFVWFFVDRVKTDRHEIDRRMIVYYKQKVSQLRAQLQRAQKERTSARADSQVGETFVLRSEVVRLQNRKRLSQRELLFYILRVNPQQGYQLFIDFFDALESRYVLAELALF